jgi:hypothetical protein
MTHTIYRDQARRCKHGGLLIPDNRQLRRMNADELDELVLVCLRHAGAGNNISPDQWKRVDHVRALRDRKLAEGGSNHDDH